MTPWYQRPTESISFEEATEIFQDNTNKENFPAKFQLLIKSIKERVEEVKLKSQQENPIAWVQPSFEQTLKLNCWIYGINYIVDFDANRGGKTAGTIINAILWIIPNNGEWIMFQPFMDHLQRTFQCIPRPTIGTVPKIKEILEKLNLKGNPKEPLDTPNNQACYQAIRHLLDNRSLQPPNPTKRTIWQGAPDSTTHTDTIMPEWRKWLPNGYIVRDSNYDLTINLEIPTEPPLSSVTPVTKTEIIFKSYDSQDTKWASSAVDGINLTEGPPKSIFNEVKLRYKYPAFAGWDYTPYEPRNTGQKTQLAYKVYTGEEQLPLTPFIFTGFGIENTPDYILPPEKRADLYRAFKGKPEEEARIKGNFYTSSPVILKNYRPEVHSLKLSFKQLKEKYLPRPLILFRGLDPGWGHVTACAWMALAPDNARFIYRYYAEAGRSIQERCLDIINLSNNKRIIHPKSPEMYKENTIQENIRITWIDYHAFKTDEQTKRPFAHNYIKAGIAVRPSLTYGDKERSEAVNDLLLPQHHLPHPETKKPPGSRLYFLCSEPGVAEAVNKMKDLFWQTFDKGEKKGLTKEAPQDYDDDELDALSYVVLNPLNYASFFNQTTQQKDIGGSGRLLFGTTKVYR